MPPCGARIISTFSSGVTGPLKSTFNFDAAVDDDTAMDKEAIEAFGVGFARFDVDIVQAAEFDRGDGARLCAAAPDSCRTGCAHASSNAASAVLSHERMAVEPSAEARSYISGRKA